MNSVRVNCTQTRKHPSVLDVAHWIRESFPRIDPRGGAKQAAVDEWREQPIGAEGVGASGTFALRMVCSAINRLGAALSRLYVIYCLLASFPPSNSSTSSTTLASFSFFTSTGLDVT